MIEANVSERTIATKFPSLKKISNTLQKKRVNKLSSTACDLPQFEIIDEFLRYDNKNPDQRIMIFFYEESLKIMSESDEWFLDGTFKSAPVIHAQLITIHVAIKGPNENTTLPCVFILSSKTDENAFKEIFSVIKDLAIKQNVKLELYF